MKQTETENLIFTAINIDTLIEKIAKKVLLKIQTDIENLNQKMEYKILLNTLIDDLDIGIRAYNVCRSLNIKTLGQLASMNKYQLRKIKNYGKSTELELENLLNKHNLFFGMNLSKYNIK